VKILLANEMESPLACSACTALPSGRSCKSSKETGKSDLGAGPPPWRRVLSGAWARRRVRRSYGCGD